MTLNNILTEYEDVWRQAALEGRAQFYGKAAGGKEEFEVVPGATCAYLIASADLRERAEAAVLPQEWLCREDGYITTAIIVVLIHLNNAHHWTWDMLANKVRDALEQGGVTVS